ncbi:hypothetical protein [Plantactinospora sp. GCM10030261]|uniref:hypothetical protein n=1 Tax=Plantactinospora sp. GCM10030261 TaxID=3273420 RepID=UPI003622B4E4
MDDLPNLLRAAATDPPPTRLDIDRLINTERRRSRTRAWTLTGTGAAALVAAVLVIPAVVAGPGAGPVGGGLPVAAPNGTTSAATPNGTTPTAVAPCAPVVPEASGPPGPLQSYDTVQPRPTEAPDDAVVRLTLTLNETLARALPAGSRVEPVQPSCRQPQFQYDPQRREYTAVARLHRDDRVGGLIVVLQPSGTQRLVCIHTDDPNGCQRSELPGGGQLLAEEVAPEGPTGFVQRSLLLERPDGTTVRFTLTNTVETRPEQGPLPSGKLPPLSLAELTALGTEGSALTLYP